MRRLESIWAYYRPTLFFPTRLTSGEVRQKLLEFTGGESPEFKGHIGTRSFEMRRAKDQGPINPLIRGEVETTAFGARVSIKMSPPVEALAVAGAFIAVGSLGLWGALFGGDSDAALHSLVLLLVGTAVVTGSFHVEVQEAKALLVEALQVELPPGERTESIGPYR